MPIQGSYESHYAAALDMYKPCRNRSDCTIQEICYLEIKCLHNEADGRVARPLYLEIATRKFSVSVH